jgi:alanyl-tRNA synthetase
VDIVQDVVRDEKFAIDRDGFEKAMAEQRAQSRSVTSFTAINEAYKALSAEGFKTQFDGYRQTEGSSTVRLLVKDGQETDRSDSCPASMSVISR